MVKPLQEARSERRPSRVSKSGGAYPIIVFKSTSALNMASCEPRRTSPYSNDLRWRMVWQRLARGLTLEQVSSNLNVDISTIWEVVKHFEEMGTVSKKNILQKTQHDLKKKG